MHFLQSFFYGRYGLDKLGKLNLAVWVAVAAVNVFVRSWVLYALCALLCVLCLFRMLSRNFSARQAENRKFEQLFGGAKARARQQQERQADKMHRYIKCKICGATLRVPRDKGRHTIRCPKCGKTFSTRIWF